MEKLISLIVIVIPLVLLVSVSSSEINRFEPSTLINDPSHSKCLQFWSNGPLTHCQLIFETQSLFQIGLKLKFLDEIQVQIAIQSEGKGKSETISITPEKLHRNQYWSQDFDINEASSITFKIIRNGKLIDLKDVENLIEYIVIVGDRVNPKKLENSENSAGSELELDEVGENFTDDPITTEEPTEPPTEPTTVITSTSTSTVSTISTEITTSSSSTTETSTEETSTEASISTTTEEITSTNDITIITSTTDGTISSTTEEIEPELISDLDIELTENWATTCKFYLTFQELLDVLENTPEECPGLSLEDGDEQLIPTTESQGFWIPCKEKSCTIQYADLESEISNFGANLYVGGQGEIEVTSSGEQKFEKLQVRQQDTDWVEYNETAPPGSNQGMITFTLKVENTGDIVIVDKLQIYGHAKALPPTPPEDDNNTVMIVLIVLGSIALVVILSGIAYFMWKKQINTRGSFRTHSPEGFGERNDLEGFDNLSFGEDRESLGRAGTFRSFDILNDAENIVSIPRVQLSERERSRTSAFKED